MREPNDWVVDCDSDACRNDWFLFKLGVRSTFDKRQLVLLNLTTGKLRVFESDDYSQITFSPTGRWFVQTFRKRRLQHVYNAKVYETASGNELIDVDAEAPRSERSAYANLRYFGCFSNDDLYFASSLDNGAGKVTKIWSMPSGRVIKTIDRYLDAIVFAKSRHFVAGEVMERPKDGPLEVFAEVWDFDSGELRNRTQIEGVVGMGHRPPKLEFMENDKWLVRCFPFNGFEGRLEVHASLNLGNSWNLDTNEVVTHPYPNDSYDPNVSCNSILPATYPRLYSTSNETASSVQLRERTTGKVMFTCSDEWKSILLTRDGKIAIFQHEIPYRDSKILSRLRGLGVPLPGVLGLNSTEPDIVWSAIDIPSGRTIASIPAQYEITYFSRDEKTLVTTAPEVPQIIRVWDFPFRRPVFWPFVSALIAPGMILMWYRLRCTRSRVHPPRSDVLA